jgi:hypothetical protein
MILCAPEWKSSRPVSKAAAYHLRYPNSAGISLVQQQQYAYPDHATDDGASKYTPRPTCSADSGASDEAIDKGSCRARCRLPGCASYCAVNDSIGATGHCLKSVSCYDIHEASYESGVERQKMRLCRRPRWPM